MSSFLPYFWKTILPDVGFLVDSFFSFSTLNISVYCLLASKISEEKSVDGLIEDPLYVTSFSLAAFKILSLCSEGLIIMCLSLSFFEFVLEFTELLGWLDSCLSLNLGSSQSLFLRISSLLLSLSLSFLLLRLSPYIRWSTWWLFIGPLCATHFSSVFVPFCFSDAITSIVLSSGSLILSSGWSNLPLNPSSEFENFNCRIFSF